MVRAEPKGTDEESPRPGPTGETLAPDSALVGNALALDVGIGTRAIVAGILFPTVIVVVALHHQLFRLGVGRMLPATGGIEVPSSPSGVVHRTLLT